MAGSSCAGLNSILQNSRPPGRALKALLRQSLGRCDQVTLRVGLIKLGKVPQPNLAGVMDLMTWPPRDAHVEVLIQVMVLEGLGWREVRGWRPQEQESQVAHSCPQTFSEKPAM